MRCVSRASLASATPTSAPRTPRPWPTPSGSTTSKAAGQQQNHKADTTLKRDTMTKSTAPAKATWKVGGHEIAVTNLDKLFWPEHGLTKGDLLEFYRDIAPTLLPYLQDRPFI